MGAVGSGKPPDMEVIILIRHSMESPPEPAWLILWACLADSLLTCLLIQYGIQSCSGILESARRDPPASSVPRAIRPSLGKTARRTSRAVWNRKCDKWRCLNLEMMTAICKWVEKTLKRDSNRWTLRVLRRWPEHPWAPGAYHFRRMLQIYATWNTISEKKIARPCVVM